MYHPFNRRGWVDWGQGAHDGPNMRVTNSAEANHYLTREYRVPYKL